MIALSAAAVEPQRGWAGPLAILAAFAVIGILHVIRERRRNLSPTPPRGHPSGDNTQVTAVPDTTGTSPDTGWWGQRIRQPDGSFLVRAQQVWRTGSSELPDEKPDSEEGEREAQDDGPADLDAWVRENLEELPYAELVRAGMKRWRVSGRTVKRRIAKARNTTES